MAQFAFGGGALFAVRTDQPNAAPVRFGALQDVSIEFSSDLKELYGQGQFALALARGKSKVTGKAKFAQINGALFNSLFFGAVNSPGQLVIAANEAASVPGAAPYQVACANAGMFQADLGVFYSTSGTALTRVNGTPGGAGQYAVSAAGTYSFSPADAGAGLFLNYNYLTSGGNRTLLNNPLMGQAPVFQAIFNQVFQGKQMTLQLNACVAQKLSLPSKLDDWTMVDLDFHAQVDGAGNLGQISVSE